MTTIAYLYIDPLLESQSEAYEWSQQVDHVYQDLGQRSELQSLIADCQHSPPQILLLRSIAELGNSLLEVSDRLKQLETLGIDIFAEQHNYQSSVWAKKSSEQIKLELSSLFQKINQEQNINRLKQGHARNRLKILPPPGKAPYGYRRGKERYIVDKSTAPVVKDFFERFILFGSLRGAVRYLEKRYGKKISPSTGKNWLMNPVYRGNLKYKNNQIITNTHTAILDRQSSAQVDRLLRRNSRFSARAASAPRSLAGLINCQKCNFPFTISSVTQHNKKKQYLYLRCHGCPQQSKCKSLNYQSVLQQVILQICDELPKAVLAIEQPDLNQIKSGFEFEIQTKQETLLKLENLVTQDILDQETASLRSYKLKTEISALETKINQLPPANLQAIARNVSLPQFWFDLSEEERRFYFREFIQKIQLNIDQDQAWTLNLIFIF